MFFLSAQHWMRIQKKSALLELGEVKYTYLTQKMHLLLDSFCAWQNQTIAQLFC